MHGYLPVGSPRTLIEQILFYLLAGCLIVAGFRVKDSTGAYLTPNQAIWAIQAILWLSGRIDHGESTLPLKAGS